MGKPTPPHLVNSPVRARFTITYEIDPAAFREKYGEGRGIRVEAMKRAAEAAYAALDGVLADTEYNREVREQVANWRTV